MALNDTVTVLIKVLFLIRSKQFTIIEHLNVTLKGDFSTDELSI